MSKSSNYIAVDLGASNGRVILGRYCDSSLTLDEIHRFPNEPIQAGDSLQWNIQFLFDEIIVGIRKAHEQTNNSGETISSIGIDSWAVDFGLLDKDNKLIGNPVHYRDKRTEGIADQVFQSISKESIYKKTGIQFLPFNTIYQLCALKRSTPSHLEKAETFLMIPDLLAWFLTGEKSNEYSNASSTQILNAETKTWDDELIKKLQLPSHIFQPCQMPGDSIGSLLPAVSEKLNGLQCNVTAVATHDTGSAVVGVPASTDRFAYISCGTWSLLGTELPSPVLTDRALELNFTNEGGYGGTTRLLKNIMGLWLLQETQRLWKENGTNYSWDEITDLTIQGTPFQSFVDPDDIRFLPPGDMAHRVHDFCVETNQTAPMEHKDVLRCITESLALKYRMVLEQLDELVGFNAPMVHMVGGGIQNELLCQWTANACGRPVVAGPTEASALGNVIVQMISDGKISSLQDGRAFIAASFPIKTYEPQEQENWQRAFERFKTLINKGSE